LNVTAGDMRFIRDALPFWQKLTDGERRLVENSLMARGYSAGDVIHNGSGDCFGLFVIKSGQVRAYITSESGKEITLYRLFDRDICIFSASCIMKNIQFDVYIEAMSETETLLIPTPVFKELNESSKAVTDFTAQLIASRFSDVMWLLERTLFTSFDKRLAAFLTEQCGINGGNTVNMTHEAIASDLGTAREVVTRMLRYFQTEGMVKLSRGKITVTDMKKLSDLTYSK